MSPKKLLACALIGAQLGIAVPCFADTITIPTPPVPSHGDPDVGAVVSPMKKGQLAPFAGVLLSPKAVASVIAELHSIQEQVKLEVDHAVAVSTAQCDFKVAETTTRLEADKKVVQAQADEQAKRIVVLNDALKKSDSSRPNTMLWLGGGFIAGVAVSIGMVYVVNQASK